MARVRIVHRTEYHYARPVRFLPHRLMTRPRDSHDLWVEGATLGFTPHALGTRWAHDVFGNSITHVDFGTATSDLLSIVSTLDLEHFPAPKEIVLEPGTEPFPVSYATEEVPDLARLIERYFPDPDRAVERWARSFIKHDEGFCSLDLLVAMTHAIKADFKYESRTAEGTNPPAVTLATRAGACRDYALLMIEAVRSLGFAARFVSGYLYNPANRGEMVGGGATHAWCEVYLPGAGWVEFDPTNGLVAGENLIRVSVARTPHQAVPVSGGYFGDRDDFLRMDVDVTVTVEGEPEVVAEAASAAGAPAEAEPEPEPQNAAA